MIALDTSALVAILTKEPEADAFAAVIRSADHVVIGLPTLFELHIVLAGRSGPKASAAAIETLMVPQIKQTAFDHRHGAAAVDAFVRFGKGRHPARLNFGDCMAYATAKVADCPLLYKGDDFGQTDIRSAL